ncbi:NAD(+)/NADH kinase [Candidatus Woesearchaeota archaeon]|nr:NAD(+)/NADH kinase [Candidatus Woesearchaeota archaeon]
MLKKKQLDQYLKNILVVYKHEHCEACAMVSEILNRLGYKHRSKAREKVTPKDLLKRALVIIVGGDGTTLRTCQKIRNDCIVFSVNSNPMLTEGYLTRTKFDDFEKRFKQFAEGKAKIRELPRLQVHVNGKKIPGLAVNEVSISRDKPYLMYLYDLDKNVEKSTGIIISTPIGSTAWVKSAGGKKLPIDSRKMEFVIREPYFGRIYRAKKRVGIVDELEFKSISDGIVVFDSINREYSVKTDDMIKITYSHKKILFTEF